MGDSYGNDNSAIAGGSQSKEVLKNLDEIALATVDITGLANTTKIHSLQFP